MIGTAHQRTGFDVPISQLEGEALIIVELFLRDVTVDRQMLGRRPQVLAESKNVYVVVP
jgi:hypothetical protein